MNNNKIPRSFLPGIIINLTDCCNFTCRYCPPYGENLCKGLEEYDESAVLTVISLAKKYGIKQVRLTGGEPFLEPQRIRRFLDTCGDSFERLVLNTNGSLLRENFEWLENYKKQIVLKISIDTLDEEHFNRITKQKKFKMVLENLLSAITYGFNIELNTVLCDQTLEEICNLIEFSVSKQINLKLLTYSTFYGNVAYEAMNIDMHELVDYLSYRSSYTSNDRLVGERGTAMLVYHIDKSKITIFDSLVKNSFTPFKCYFNCCEEECLQYPCDHGAFSITISTDGIMSICRGRKDYGNKIFLKSELEIEKMFVKQLKQFQNCFSINVNVL